MENEKKSVMDRMKEAGLITIRTPEEKEEAKIRAGKDLAARKAEGHIYLNIERIADAFERIADSLENKEANTRRLPKRRPNIPIRTP